ncbi:hypothetical protein EDF72_1210 [Delftia acidovorans]|uniref:hypothetical protein n=1 Tax=Delftia acidovorans TaxID=80866 RepID=UPI000FA9992A|nr:hypothetical protein [Delftia acidovorans]ROR02093.1 hypothetical protein EDF72_1210 [Delftia acidovorans]
MAKESRQIGAIGWIGIAATAAYATAMFCFVDGRWADLQGLSLNELGDFLAGAFGPLAILWLVLGFFQQGAELRQNSAALKLQAEELKNSVEQQAELVAVSREQLNNDREIFSAQQADAAKAREEQERRMMADFRVDNLNSSMARGENYRHHLRVLNLGYRCTDVYLILELSNAYLENDTVQHLDNMKTADFYLVSQSGISIEGSLTIHYYDGLGIERTSEFHVRIKDHHIEIIPVAE